MADVDAEAIQQDLISGVAAELDFDGAEQIGRGGFGVVYRCGQPELDRMVAVKVLTNELDAASGIRLLGRSHAGDDREQACRHAAELLAGIDPVARPLANLQARLLLVETLTAAGRAADDDLALVCAQCAQHGLPRLLIDAGLG